MNRRLLLPLFVLLFTTCTATGAGSIWPSFDHGCAAEHPRDTAFIDLSGKTAFRPGDDEVWRSKFIDEHEGWNFINVPSSWERQGFPLLDGFGWYHIRFQIPQSMKNDSLLLVMSAVDDADETFLNGVMIGKTGAFPPNARSECKSLRVYPLPRGVREDYNLLAVRVYDMADSGGITGSIFRIIRADSIASVLNEIVDDPFRPPDLMISNGVCISGFNPKSSCLEWSKTHLFNELEAGLYTDETLSKLTLSVNDDGAVRELAACPAEKQEYYRNTGVIHSAFKNGLEVFWYHPHSTHSRILVVMAQTPKRSKISDVGLLSTFTKSAWTVKQIEKKDFEKRRIYFVLAFNSCCEELAEKDLDEFLRLNEEEGKEAWSLERELAYWERIGAEEFYFPATLTDSEKTVYRQSVSLIVEAQSREAGLSEGQIVSAFTPASHAYTIPRDHIVACAALAEAGVLDLAWKGLDFLKKSPPGAYTFYPVDGIEYGIGYEQLVSPTWLFGNGGERIWQHKEDALLSYETAALYLEAFDALRRNTRRKTDNVAKPFSDSAFIAPHWKELSARVADVLLFMRDSSGLIPHGGGGLSEALSPTPNMYASLHAAAALRIAAHYASLLHDKIKAFLYDQAAQQTMRTISRTIGDILARTSAKDLSPLESSLFHPFIADGITLELFEPKSVEAEFALDLIEQSFRIEDTDELYNAQPDGDWFTRQARPQVALKLARAYAINGDLARAEELFAVVTRTAFNNNCMLPELIDPVTKNWYGGLPSIGAGAAEYILTAETLSRIRLEK